MQMKKFGPKIIHLEDSFQGDGGLSDHNTGTERLFHQELYAPVRQRRPRRVPVGELLNYTDTLHAGGSVHRRAGKPLGPAQLRQGPQHLVLGQRIEKPVGVLLGGSVLRLEKKSSRFIFISNEPN